MRKAWGPVLIRLMNLYGFSKVRATNPSGVQSPENRRMTIYHNANFQRDKPFLLRNIQRKSDQRITTTLLGSSVTTAKKKKQAAATRHKESTKVDKKVPGEASNAQGPSGSWSFTFSGTGSMSSTARQAMGNGGPSGEDASRNVMFVPPATARRDGTWELPINPPLYPDYGTLMALYNTCYSILLAALLAMSPKEAPSENEEQEGPLCALCEHFKENLGP